MIVGQIIGYISKNMKETIPEPMVRNSVERINKDLEEGLKKQKMSRQDYMKALNLTEEQFDKQIREKAEREVTDYLIFKALEKSESAGLQVSDVEVQKERQVY